MNEIITKVEDRIKELTNWVEQSEQNVTNNIKQHQSLLGMFSEAQHILDMITNIADTVKPEDPVTTILNTIDEISHALPDEKQ